MIDADKRKAIFLLHQEGMSAREISRRLHLGRNTVGRVIAQEGRPLQRASKPLPAALDPDLLRQLYEQCNGYLQRVHEKLREEHGLQITYSTLTRWMRKLGLSLPPTTRCERVPDEPGAEMQHDTSPYKIPLGGVTTKLQASLLYLRYSKRRYLQFYRVFDRFRMKCFLHRALLHWAYVPKLCVIDNTNLARLRGLGSRAVMVPEMEAFAKSYGFAFLCHAPKHPDRKAGEERSFHTVETNFLPGRSFENLEDLNRQALEWSTVRMEQRPQGKAGLIPAQAFEHERHFLQALTPHLPAPYLLPPGQPAPRYQPHHRKASSLEEEKRLRTMAQEISAYVDFLLKSPGLQRHQCLRRLFAISRRMSPELFLCSARRAHRYRITCLDTLERIARLYMAEGQGELFPSPTVDEGFRDRPAYQEGALTDLPDLSQYDTSSHDPDDPRPPA